MKPPHGISQRRFSNALALDLAKSATLGTFPTEAGRYNPDHPLAPIAVTKEKAAEIAADFMTTFYQTQIGALENARVPDAAGSILAGLLFRHDQRTTARNVLLSYCCRMGRCCAESGGTAAVNGAMRRDLI